MAALYDAFWPVARLLYGNKLVLASSFMEYLNNILRCKDYWEAKGHYSGHLSS